MHLSLGASLVVQMVKNLQCERLRFNPWVRRIPWRRNWQPTPVFLPGEVIGSQRVGNYRSDLACMYALTTEKAMAPHSSTLAWKIPWTEEPGGLQSMGLLRVRHDCVTSLSLFTFMHWRRKWKPTPGFLPGEFQGRESLVGCYL